MAALQVEGIVVDGTTVLLYEVEMGADPEQLEEGDTYDSSQCAY